MADEANSKDLIFSYSVDHDGVVDGTDKGLKEALANGYRIVDVIATQPSPGGNGFVCITVVLSNDSNRADPYKASFGK
ncbi:MAG TPA: hypothetical protein VH575_25195 [Gemmataceae bacterium]|jgi:hypothetical protein